FWRGKHEIKWTGSDPDKDTLTYQVFSSSDNGEPWPRIGNRSQSPPGSAPPPPHRPFSPPPPSPAAPQAAPPGPAEIPALARTGGGWEPGLPRGGYRYRAPSTASTAGTGRPLSLRMASGTGGLSRGRSPLRRCRPARTNWS